MKSIKSHEYFGDRDIVGINSKNPMEFKNQMDHFVKCNSIWISEKKEHNSQD